MNNCAISIYVACNFLSYLYLSRGFRSHQAIIIFINNNTRMEGRSSRRANPEKMPRRRWGGKFAVAVCVAYLTLRHERPSRPLRATWRAATALTIARPNVNYKGKRYLRARWGALNRNEGVVWRNNNIINSGQFSQLFIIIIVIIQ